MTTPVLEKRPDSTLMNSEGFLSKLLSSLISQVKTGLSLFLRDEFALTLFRFNRFIDEGCLMMVVRAIEPSMQLLASAAMLRHSTHRVQTNEHVCAQLWRENHLLSPFELMHIYTRIHCCCILYLLNLMWSRATLVALPLPDNAPIQHKLMKPYSYKKPQTRLPLQL